MRESLIVEQYISGLGSAEIKRHVQFAHPTTLDHAISLAVEFEAFEGAQILPRKPKLLDEMPVLALTNSERGMSNRAQENAKIGQLEDSIKDVQQSLKQVMEKMDKNPYRNNSARSSQRNFRHKKLVQCFNCHKDGHYMRECPDLKTTDSAPAVQTRDKPNGKTVFNNGQVEEGN